MSWFADDLATGSELEWPGIWPALQWGFVIEQSHHSFGQSATVTLPGKKEEGGATLDAAVGPLLAARLQAAKPEKASTKVEEKPPQARLSDWCTVIDSIVADLCTLPINECKHRMNSPFQMQMTSICMFLQEPEEQKKSESGQQARFGAIADSWVSRDYGKQLTTPMPSNTREKSANLLVLPLHQFKAPVQTAP